MKRCCMFIPLPSRFANFFLFPLNGSLMSILIQMKAASDDISLIAFPPSTLTQPSITTSPVNQVLNANSAYLASPDFLELTQFFVVYRPFGISSPVFKEDFPVVIRGEPGSQPPGRGGRQATVFSPRQAMQSQDSLSKSTPRHIPSSHTVTTNGDEYTDVVTN